MCLRELERHRERDGVAQALQHHAGVRDNFCGVSSFLPFMWVPDIKLWSLGLQCQAESPFSKSAGSPLICETVSHWGPWSTTLARLVSKVKRAIMFASPHAARPGL